MPFPDAKYPPGVYTLNCDHLEVLEDLLGQERDSLSSALAELSERPHSDEEVIFLSNALDMVEETQRALRLDGTEEDAE